MSSDKSNRVTKNTLDYKEYHTRGNKVAKETKALQKITEGFEQLAIMSKEKLIDDEKKLSRKIKRFLKEYEDLDILHDVDEVEAAVAEIKEIIDNYEEVHIELERELKREYEGLYKDSKELILATAWIKNAKVDIKRRKQKEREEEKAEKLREKEEKLRKEEEEKAEKLREKEEKLRKEEEKLRKEEEQKVEKIKKEEEDKAEKLRKKEEKLRKEEEQKAEKLRKEEEEKAEKLRKEEEEKAEKLREKEEKIREKAEKLRKKEEKLRKEEEEKAEKFRKKEEKLRKEKEENENLLRIEAQKIFREKEKLLTEEKHLRKRIDQDLINMIDDDSSFIENLDRNISTVRSFIHEYSYICAKIENFLGTDEYDHKHAEKFEKHNALMNNYVREMNKKIQSIKFREIELKEQNEKLKSLREEEKRAKENEIRNKEKLAKISTFIGVFSNIKERAYLLKSKYELALNELTDSQILEKEKDVKTLNGEFHKILDLITELIRASPADYDEADEVLHKASTGKNKLKLLKDAYEKDLVNELKRRDLSAEKVKNASFLKIEVPKFHGYGSKLDFYSFRSEFEKLISPRIQEKLLPDYLKNNYLEGHALELVREIHEMDQIWERLNTSFGNVSILLNDKLLKVEKSLPLWKIKSDDKFIQIATKLINEMKELCTLSEKHNIEEILFHPSNLTKVYDLIGRKRQLKVMKKQLDKKLTVQQKWLNIISFLEDELLLKEELVLMEKSKHEKSESSCRSKSYEEKSKSYLSDKFYDVTKCVICGKNDHVATVTKKGKTFVNYFSCPKFTEMNPKQRLSELREKGLCYQCLSPGVKKGHEGSCFSRYNCPDEFHKKFDTGYHILVCDRHKNKPENLKLLDEYKSKYIENSEILYKDFSKKLSISFHAGTELNSSYKAENNELSEEDCSIYMLQTIQINGKKLNLFYDTGATDIVCKKEAVDFLSTIGRAHKIQCGPITLCGVGNKQTICQNGAYSIKLALYNGREVTMTGICLDTVTSEFPTYPLNDVEIDIHREYRSINGDPSELPKLPKFVGGSTDVMIGIQYLRYHPKPCFSLPNGLTIYESQFENWDKTRGLVGGPHKVFTEIHKRVKGTHVSISAYITDVVKKYENSLRLSFDVPLLNGKEISEPENSEIGIPGNEDFFKIVSQNSHPEIEVDSVAKSSFLPMNCPKADKSRSEDPKKDLTHDAFERDQSTSDIELETNLAAMSSYLLDDSEGNLAEKKGKLIDKNNIELNVNPKDGNNLAAISCHLTGANVNKRAPKNFKRFEDAENAGTEVSYRCVRCRGCPECKKGKKIECISIQEEVEQALIDKTVHVDLIKNCVKARLPFLSDPKYKLAPNRNMARKIYNSQTKMSLNEKQDIIASEKKLQELGFVDYLENLTPDQRQKIENSPNKYYIPWRSVWNTNSKTTECRLVFDASHPTSTGVSLNDLLAKGRNNMNKLVEIGIRWQIRKKAFHSDVRKMYNTILLEEDHWCYQLYLWHEDLDPLIEPKVKVIKTLIYGVRSSGNQAERGYRETGRLMSIEYPRQYEVIRDDTYVDDMMSGENHQDQLNETCDGLKTVANKGGFGLKPFTCSDHDPPEILANDDQSINVAGMKWFPKKDLLSLNIGELNFSKKHRGKKVASMAGLIPESFTRRDCAGKVAEIFDLLGKFTPITAGLKLDLSDLSKRNLEWDDNIPIDLKSTWQDNFKLIQELGEIKFKRAIVPEDALNLDIETIECADASQNLICSATYARFKRKSGSYSCQLLLGKSKIVPPGTIISRAELFGADLNASTGHVVYLALNEYIKSRLHLTDSQIVLFWITNAKLQMKQVVRGRVIEITRLTDRNRWFHIDGQNMTADIGTRKGAKLGDISESSPWMCGHAWAKLDEKDFPIRSASQIKLSAQDLKFHNDESVIPNSDWINKQLSRDFNHSFVAMSEEALNKISERYKFSNYLIDPNRFRLRKVVRIVALVFLFIKKLKLKISTKPNSSTISNYKDQIGDLPSQFKTLNDKYLVTSEKNECRDFPFNCKKGLVICLNDELLMMALNYFFQKATLEILHFLPKKSYKKISKEKNGILFYTGRILPSQKCNGKLNLSDVCIDLSMSSFFVPLVDKFSPLAYALINEIHWYSPDAKHSGNETVLRHVQKVAYIMEGRLLVKQFRQECARCRLLNRKAIKVAMGPVSDINVCIAPAFYNSQVDIFGPYSSYSNLNKRASMKIWFLLFCCCTTGAVDIKVMEDYSTNSFVLAFIRFSCKVGFPKRLLPDAGSQLVKGCQTMTLVFSDIKSKLNKEYGIEFETCPVGAHYMHGKVERKIKQVQESFSKSLQNERMSIIQWETLGDQVANSINNLPIGIGNVVEDLENLDILTPNRLLLARNNDRSPSGTVSVSDDPKRIIRSNNEVFDTWFQCWLVSCVPKLMTHPKWYDSSRDSKIGDIVLFLKSEKEFDKQYQYGIIRGIKASRDGKIRQIDIEYQNHNETVKRFTNRGVREVVVIHPVDEMSIIRQINGMYLQYLQ